ncbi:uncharacterized protein LOC122664784 [Telopea speciosissima]|uniref:uncharacterized protein LOC122664784 n=1 Tax=Telopea speciosissima TaxID=54955 RepID=UPI001CC52D7B|nr:uncharacterized protein LOC122664784 [Telopea speciosissima]
MTMLQVSGVITDALVVFPSTGVHKSLESKSFPAFSDAKSLLSGGMLKKCSSFSILRVGSGMEKCRMRGLTVRASGNSGDNMTPVAPLQFESPVGQLLVQIMQTHPHLLPAAIDQQLEHLRTDRDAQKDEASSSSSQDFLYKYVCDFSTLLCSLILCLWTKALAFHWLCCWNCAFH